MTLLPYVTGVSGGVSAPSLELGMVGGLALAAIVKWGLGRAWPGVFGKPHLGTGRHRSRA